MYTCRIIIYVIEVFENQIFSTGTTRPQSNQRAESIESLFFQDLIE
jgi:hypothetical protein